MGWSISVRPSAVGGEHDPQSIMIKISEAVGESTDLLDDQVDGFGAAVGDAVGVEVGEHLLLPRSEGPAEPSDFGDRARRGS